MFFATRAESKTCIRDVSFWATSFAVNYGGCEVRPLVPTYLPTYLPT